MPSLKSTSFLLAVLLTTGAQAGPSRFSLDPNSTEPQRHVEGLKQETHKRFWEAGEKLSGQARETFEERIAKGKKLSMRDLQCLATQFTKAAVDGALAGENSLGMGVPGAVLERYSYFLLMQIEYFCEGPPGGGANLGDKIFGAWCDGVDIKAQHKSSVLEEVRAVIAKSQSGQKLTPREVTVAAAIAIILAAKELVPAPF